MKGLQVPVPELPVRFPEEQFIKAEQVQPLEKDMPVRVRIDLFADVLYLAIEFQAVCLRTDW